MFPTEFRLCIDKKQTFFEKYIDGVIAGNIKNLTIKEEWIMLEELKKQREELAAEVEKIRQTDLEAIKNERFEAEKQKIADEVIAEYNEKVAAAELKVQHYDFVIALEEEKARVAVENEISEQHSEYDEVQ